MMSDNQCATEDSIMSGMSKRIQVTVPDKLAEELQRWADYDGRPLSNLALTFWSALLMKPKKRSLNGQKKLTHPPRARGNK
jgi:hypothetical protein